MKKHGQVANILSVLAVLGLFLCCNPRVSLASVDDIVNSDWDRASSTVTGVCSRGTGNPPFLGTPISPNLLIIVDNSGSMYDLSNVDTESISSKCYDHSYDTTETYVGYFEPKKVYRYNITNGYYEEVVGATDPTASTDPSGVSLCPARSAPRLTYTITDATIAEEPKTLCLSGNDTDADSLINEVTHFAATGNFLNWLAASKFDVEKMVLTGGKYDPEVYNDPSNPLSAMIMETRGCSNRRFVKEVTADAWTDSTGTEIQSSMELTFGVRPPMEEHIDSWSPIVTYTLGQKVASGGRFYTALDKADNLNVKPGSLTDQTYGYWAGYYLNRWNPDQDYAPGSIVYAAVSGNMYRTKDGGHSSNATELQFDTGIEWMLYNLTHIEIYPPSPTGFNNQACQDALNELNGLSGDTTDATVLGTDGKSRLGRLKDYTQECMGFPVGGSPKTIEGYSRTAFNLSMQECWYYNKFDIFQPGGGTVTSIKGTCSELYTKYDIDPADLTSYDNSYICSGVYNQNPPVGYVGRCWETPDPTCIPEPCDSRHDTIDKYWYDASSKRYLHCNSSTKMEVCLTPSYDKSTKTWSCPSNDWKGLLVCDSGESTTTIEKWTDDKFRFYDTCRYSHCVCNNEVKTYCATNYTTSAGVKTCAYPGTAVCSDDWQTTYTRGSTDDNWYLIDDVSLDKNDGNYCANQAIRDFCKYMKIPEVIDPTDTDGLTSSVWNAPAILVDSGMVGQMGDPLLVTLGYVKRPIPPEGVIQHTSSELRIGVMTFNDNGAKTECETAVTQTYNTNPIEYDCPLEGNKDGAELLVYIDKGNQTELVNAINSIKAMSWTPLAEAMHNAIGYYTQRTDMRLNTDDYFFNSEIDNPSVTTYDADTSYNAGDVVVSTAGAIFRAKNAVSGVDPDDDFTQVDWEYYYPVLTPGTTYTKGQIVTEERDGADRFIAVKSGVSSSKYAMYDTGVTWRHLPKFSIDPVQYFCQSNNILILTEGASTADVSTGMLNWLSAHPINDADVAVDGQCSNVDPIDSAKTITLYGSTYLDDYTYFGYQSDPVTLYTAANAKIDPADDEYKNTISTYIVSTAELLDYHAEVNECDPADLMKASADQGRLVDSGGEALIEAKTADELQNKLTYVFSEIMNRASSGSAASVISSSRGGEGAVYQAIFWPQQPRANLGLTSLYWSGDVHALFLGPGGELFEDNDHDGLLDEGSDASVRVYYDESDKKTMACPGDHYSTETGCESGFKKSISDIDYIWSAVDWLAGLSDSDLENNRPVDTTDAGKRWRFDATKNYRYIFTWDDLNNDGMVAANEVLDFTASTASTTPTSWTASVSADRDDLVNDFNYGPPGSITSVNHLVKWTRGIDHPFSDVPDGLGGLLTDYNGNGLYDEAMRNRQYSNKADGSEPFIWRLGDIIHSTPTLVGKPAEGYDLLYKDSSYLLFVGKYNNRRHMVYFGANDGMLHAVNAGFYNSEQKGFLTCPAGKNYLDRTNKDADGNLIPTIYRGYTDDNSVWQPSITGGQCDPTYQYADLGEEMWAYVPYNLLPHLSCLASTDYQTHKYFVDGPPRIFDVQIFEDDCEYVDQYGNPKEPDCTFAKHPGGWGTILVGYMRFGGAPVEMDALDGVLDNSDNRRLQSSYFILDITDPEGPPELLGEISMVNDVTPSLVDLGYTTPMPTVVPMHHGATAPEKPYGGASSWYLVLGNGPVTVQGGNDVHDATLAVLPLDWLLGKVVNNTYQTKRSIRIPDEWPSSTTNQGGTIKLQSTHS
ncbi:MAG: hypothetical protein OEV64_05830, partial [Desulfobulbaceae bacterium]|nr:hypothetical protein [Desulfobulbaceae bacterium]